MSNHYPTCKTCAQLQGRIYSISGKDKRFPALSEAFKRGYNIVHPNCRHVVNVWVEDMKTDDEISEAVKNSSKPFDIDPRSEKEREFYAAQQTRHRKTVDKTNKNVIIKEKSYTNGRYPCSQQQIDSLLESDFNGVNFTSKPIYNPRIRCNGRVKIVADYKNNVLFIEAIEIGKQDKPSAEFLEDTIIHEELEARIAMRSVRSSKYKTLYNSNDDVRHEYINKRIKRYFQLKGWWYDNE